MNDDLTDPTGMISFRGMARKPAKKEKEILYTFKAWKGSKLKFIRKSSFSISLEFLENYGAYKKGDQICANHYDVAKI
jgi:hypothetical protein